MFISGLNNAYGNKVNEKIFGIQAAQKPENEEESVITEKEAEDVKESQKHTKDSIEISSEGRLAAEQGAAIQEQDASGAKKKVDEDTSEKQSGKVAVNEGKRARQIAAAQNQEQVQQVLALLQKDLADCKAGLEKGWCDESEIAKVEALMNQAKSRLSQVPRKADQEDAQGGLDAFDMASLM